MSQGQKVDVKRKLLNKSERVKSVDIHPTEPWVLTSLFTGQVQILNFKSKSVLKTFEVSDLPVRTAKFISRKQWFIAGSDDMCLSVFNYNTMEKVKTFDAHTDYIRSVAVHPTAPLVLSASDDMNIKMWNWEKGWQCTMVFEGHMHYVMQVAFNPKDTNTFASASLDKTIKMWGLNSSQPNFTLEGHEKGVNCIDFFHGGDKPYLMSGSDDKTVRIWDFQTKACVKVLEGHTNNISDVCFHPELPLIITGSEDGSVRLWNSHTYRLEQTLTFNLERVWTIGYCKGTNALAIGCDEGTVVVKLGSEEPVVSMDSSGAQQLNGKTNASGPASAGSRSSSPVLTDSQDDHNIIGFAEAFNLCTQNPDPQRRKEDLRWFITTILSASSATFSASLYIPLSLSSANVRIPRATNLSEVFSEILPMMTEETTMEVFEILTSKAKHSPVSSLLHRVNLYETIYALHVYRGNYKSAALAMIELASRLSVEKSIESSNPSGTSGPAFDEVSYLEKICACYLAAINALQLVPNPNSTLIRTPYTDDVVNGFAGIRLAEDTDGDDEAEKRPSTKKPSKKRLKSDSQIDQSIDHSVLLPSSRPSLKKRKNKTTFAILTVKDLQVKYLVTRTRLKLIRARGSAFPVSTVTKLTPSDMLVLLVESGLFDTAFSLCEAIPDLDKKIPFENLCIRCVRTQQQLDSRSFMPMPDVFSTQFVVESEVSGQNGVSPGDVGWRLLEFYLTKFDSRETNFRYTKTAIDTLLGLDREMELPRWLVMSLKNKDIQALVRLYLRHGLSEKAERLVTGKPSASSFVLS